MIERVGRVLCRKICRAQTRARNTARRETRWFSFSFAFSPFNYFSSIARMSANVSIVTTGGIVRLIGKQMGDRGGERAGAPTASRANLLLIDRTTCRVPANVSARYNSEMSHTLSSTVSTSILAHELRRHNRRSRRDQFHPRTSVRVSIATPIRNVQFTRNFRLASVRVYMYTVSVLSRIIRRPFVAPSARV